MNREQLAHVVRAAATITGDIVIIGSQAILGAADVGRLPEEATCPWRLTWRSATTSTPARQMPSTEPSANSRRSKTFGHYAQGVEIRTAVLPAGWEDRAEILDRPDSRPGFARCLEPHDLVVSKLVAGREKDIAFATALIEHGFVTAGTLHERAEMLDQPYAVVRRARELIVRCTPRE